MFMFVFSAVLIAIAGVFFQLVNALTTMINAQQTAIGQQMMSWHMAAYNSACQPYPLASSSYVRCDTRNAGAWGAPTNDCPLSLGVNNYPVTAAPSTAPASSTFGTYISRRVFIGNWGSSQARLLVTYIPAASGAYSGYSAAVIGGQLRKAYQDASVGTVTTVGGVNQVTLTYTDQSNGAAYQIVVKPFPSDVPANTTVIVSYASACS